MIPAIALLLLAAALSPVDQIAPAPSRMAAPDFTRSDASGRPLTLSSYNGHVVLLDFWATYCGGCKVEIPWYIEFARKYRTQGLVVIGVSMDDDGMKRVKPFLTAHHIDYPVVIGNDQIAARYKLSAMPMTLLIDRPRPHRLIPHRRRRQSDVRTPTHLIAG
ncbi:MAG: TlpA family protein disulfide reductase [Acidobacteriota bacterium]|nr:TlpA family protein disulfide reductase [Acidobacteriota bacterium]